MYSTLCSRPERLFHCYPCSDLQHEHKTILRRDGNQSKNKERLPAWTDQGRSQGKLQLLCCWADTYENDLNPDKYEGPVFAANECCGVIPIASRMDALVLDVAAGTGFLGKELYQRGFRKIHALDPSPEMLEKARAKNVYQRFITEFISEVPLQIDADTYDIVVSSGGMGQGHVPAGALWEMLRITRKGGYIIWSMREEYLREPAYNGILEALIENMEESGKWSIIKKRVIPKYYEEKEGIVFVIKKS